MVSSIIRADPQAHLRQGDECPRDRRLDLYGDVFPRRWVLYGLQPCRGSGRAATGTPDVDGNSRRVAPVLIHPLRESHGAGAGRQPRVRRVARPLT